mmetsp:Transcript_69361/g.166304  ORF Transcript_69361/g.166304 Transcript_69361/m.166304 type:complete len:962 (-) Transcript_69361:125-3010(-)
MKGIQGALGMDSPKNMKGLQVFIADIRNCPTKEAEEKRVDKEMAKIRQKFTQKNISGYDKKKYVWKLLYAYMLGYDVDFGHRQAVELASSSKFSEKAAGYLAVSLLLSQNTEILRLVVNSVKTDIASASEYVAALAMNTVANIGGSEFADNLWSDIAKILLNPGSQYKPYIKRKAAICLLRLFRKDNETLQTEQWKQRMCQLFQEKDIGFITSLSGFFLAILEQGSHPPQAWAEVVPMVIAALHSLVSGADCPDHYEYYRVPAPWLQTKLLRILQFFPVKVFNPEVVNRMNTILHNILAKPAVHRSPPPSGTTPKKRCKADAERQNRSNAEHAILFEAMNLMIHLEDKCKPDTTKTAAGLLGSFISSADANIRYLGLETMARLASNPETFEHLERYKNLILDKMKEPDISIRRQALNLLYALCRPDNWQQIVDELLEIVGSSDSLLQEELVLKIAILAEKNAPNFKWYFDVVFKMLETAPEAVSDDVWYRVVQVVTGFDQAQDPEKISLQRHATSRLFGALAQGFPHETMVKLGAYMTGEFGHLLPDNIPPKGKFDVLAKHFSRGSPTTRAILVMSVVKLLNANPEELRQVVHAFLEDMQDQQDLELQQRSCELINLMSSEEMLENVLAVMPVYAESVQQNNPLIQRLKFQRKGRAATRNQLEEAAKSEGGVYKPGRQAGGPQGLLKKKGKHSNAGDDESESGSEDESDDGQAGTNGGAPKDLWTNLCIMPQGPFYASGNLCLDVKHEYQEAQGRITVLYRNAGSEPITAIRVQLPEVPFMRFNQANQAPQQLRPGESQQHYVQVQCMRPFLEPARYLVEYSAGGQSGQLPLMLPAIMTKFLAPTQLAMPQFRQFFEKFESATAVGQAKVPSDQWPNFLQKGFQMFMLPESNPSMCLGVGTFHTGTPDPQNPGKMMTVPCMVRLDYEPNRRMTKIDLRAQNAQVSQALLKIFQTYLLVPSG